MTQIRNASFIGALGVAGLAGIRLLEQCSLQKEESAKILSPVEFKTNQLFENCAWKNERAVGPGGSPQIIQAKTSNTYLGITKKQ